MSSLSQMWDEICFLYTWNKWDAKAAGELPVLGDTDQRIERCLAILLTSQRDLNA